MKKHQGNLIIRKGDNTDYSQLEEVTGYLSIYSNAKLDNLKSVGGYLYINSEAKLDNLTSVGGYLEINSDAKLEAPNLTSVGGNLYIYSGAKLEAPNLTSVGGNLYIYSGAKLEAPNLTSVGGYLEINSDAKLEAPKLFLALAGLTTESTETKEEVLARFEKGDERELIGYRFRNDDFNRMTRSLYKNNESPYKLFGDLIHLAPNCNAVTKITELNLLDTFCEPVYKEATISIEEAETILRSIGRNEKIKA